MSKIAELPINSFASSEMQADVLPSEEESIFVLTSSQLQEIISRAIQPLQDLIESLETTVTSQGEEIAVLRASVASLTKDEKLDHADIRDLFESIATLAPRPSTAPPAPPTPPRGEKSIARIAKIDDVLKSRGPTTLSQMGHILKISPKEMNRLLAKLDMRRYELHARPGDAREKVLRLRAQIR
jgi:hypothetical protein